MKNFPSNVNSPSMGKKNYLADMDYSVLQQCMHCGMCLPTCPTYEETGRERNSPRGRIALMRAVADGELKIEKAFADEMYYCLGCLACVSACPAGVDYADLFEKARAQAEEEKVLTGKKRRLVRWLTLRLLFTRPRLLRFVGRSLWLYQASKLQAAFRGLRLNKLLPKRYRELEELTPTAEARFSHQQIPLRATAYGEEKYQVGLLTGCVQDIVFASVNADTAEVLRHNHCTVITPRVQHCCGSLHGHNGEYELSKEMARKNIDAFDLSSLDSIITNAAGCGSHLKHYDRLLADDPEYADKAREWSAKCKDIHEWLDEIGLVTPQGEGGAQRVTYHEACHLCHGQGIRVPPRNILRAIPGLELVELEESMWCCGSAGIYNITQPETSRKLRDRKIGHIRKKPVDCIASANPGCNIQIQAGLQADGAGGIPVKHPVTILAEAYRK
ncbi:MAG: (Fe-S)-binding protein [Opitutales bacterium]|nr:(Fe-S)-binding protein [Opitutales bacterium]